MDARERYFWDLAGYLVVRNVLTAEELSEYEENETWSYSKRHIPMATKVSLQRVNGQNLRA